jgi:hypothetical protein
MFGLPGGIEWIILIVVVIALIIIPIKWIVASFKAFKSIREIETYIGYIYNILKENQNKTT